MADTIAVTASGARAIFARWLARGDAIAVFSNHDLGHPQVGHTLFLPLDAEERGRVEIGRTRAPDGTHGLGWRYLLETVTTDLGAFSFEEE